MSTLSVGDLQGLAVNSNVVTVPTGHTLNAVDGLQIGGVAQGVATAFTPSWTNFTPGNAVESWHYVRVNNLLYFGGVTILGTTSSVTGFMEMDFPVGTQVSTDGAPAGQASYGMTGLAAYGQLDQQASDLRFFVSTAGSTYVQQALTSATVPATWTSTNSIRAWGVVAIS